MRRSEWLRVAAIVGAAQCWGTTVRADEQPMFRWRASIELGRPGAFVALPLSVEAYAHTLQPELRDLRIFDARGERVAFALRVPRTGETRTIEHERDAVTFTPVADDAQAARALIFELGGALPVTQLDLQFAGLIAPVKLEGRGRVEEPWRALGEHVFYRIERDGKVKTSPLALRTTLRQVRVVPDPRTPKLDAASTKLVVHASLATMVFAMQGEPPFTLHAGSPTAAPGALPESVLIPGGEASQVSLGAAKLGAWSEVEAVVRQADDERRMAERRPWLLWSVLLAGVGGLGFMVWRLARKPQA